MPFPNKDTQFKPGQSGNPNGLPKGFKRLSTWINELANDEEFEANVLDAKLGISLYKGAPMKAIVQVAITKAVNGDLRWADWLAKYSDDKRQEIDITSKGESITQPVNDDLIASFIAQVKDDTKQK